MNKLILALYEKDGHEETNLFCGSPASLPDCGIVAYSVLEVTGKTYAEKKANLQGLALDFQFLDRGGLSCGELFEIQTFFEKNARRYGLVSEFSENCII